MCIYNMYNYRVTITMHQSTGEQNTNSVTIFHNGEATSSWSSPYKYWRNSRSSSTASAFLRQCETNIKEPWVHSDQEILKSRNSYLLKEDSIPGLSGLSFLVVTRMRYATAVHPHSHKVKNLMNFSKLYIRHSAVWMNRNSQQLKVSTMIGLQRCLYLL